MANKAAAHSAALSVLALHEQFLLAPSPPPYRAAREQRLRAPVQKLVGGAAILAGLCLIYSSSPWVLIAAALIGAYLGYKGERLGRAYVERRLSRNRPG
jgi:hypothetical protein